jgi:hypothetical protein
MPQWLLDQVLQVDSDRAPLFALRSTVNFIKALTFEIKAEYGENPLEQFNTSRTASASNFLRRNRTVPYAVIFEPLFYSLTYAMSLVALSAQAQNRPVTFHSSVVIWYYSYYNAFRAILGATNQMVGDNHRAVINAVTTLRTQLIHPFNIVANRTNGEIYEVSLPKYPRTVVKNLVEPFEATQDAARGMLLQYMKGTADWETKRVKDKMLQEGRYPNFRTQAARAARDRRLPNQVSMMNCIFRYRGKANYRDAVFFTYGNWQVNDASFITDLAESARFAFIMALTATERLIGVNDVKQFIDDLRANFRSLDAYEAAEKFWTDFYV